ncbi:MAG: hypothetical protein WBB36_05335, partial [Chitinophagales bacterium]
EMQCRLKTPEDAPIHKITLRFFIRPGIRYALPYFELKNSRLTPRNISNNTNPSNYSTATISL